MLMPTPPTPAALVASAISFQTAPSPNWWSASVDSALAQAGENRAELEKALQQVPAAQREGMAFLIANMPVGDLEHLTAKFLLENVAIAYSAYDACPWKSSISQTLFLNEILPYASMNEARDDSRAMLRAKCLPLIAGCKTPGEAAQALNRKLFPLVKVKYSPQRNRPDQAPTETIATGVATCSGLSILLVDACRAVGVPARIAGVANWADDRGNHTWVEVWDGDWHFTGATEPDDKGLDHAWFQNDASKAKVGDLEHAVWATSFAKTGSTYPLVWDRENKTVPAVEVTTRYIPAPVPTAGAAVPAADATTASLRVAVMDKARHRMAVPVIVRDITDGKITFSGRSKGETDDRNNFLTFALPPDREYSITVEAPGRTVQRGFHSGAAGSTEMSAFQIAPAPSDKSLSARDAADIKTAFAAYFAATPEQQATYAFPARLEKLLLTSEPAVRTTAWEAYKAASIHAKFKSDFDAKQVTFKEYLSPYTLKTVGTRPTNGWPLFIAMHGGGNAGKVVNDQQWGQMQHYYRDHPELGGYQYLALRAPNDTWNGFYDVYVYPMIHNLVQQFLIYGDIDPNKVFIMGYSHGGYGAFAIGPKEPDLFAAIHSSAGAPTDGETTGVTLRNTIFTNMVGGLDTAYGRLDRDTKFAKEMDTMRGDRTDLYPVAVVVAPNTEHSRLKDRDKIVDMYSAIRNPVPRDLTWLMTDTVITDFFWLHTDAPAKEREIDATCNDNNTVLVTTKGGVTDASLLLDNRLIDVHNPVVVTLNGQSVVHPITPSLRTLGKTMAERGDPDRAFTVEIPLN